VLMRCLGLNFIFEVGGVDWLYSGKDLQVWPIETL